MALSADGSAITVVSGPSVNAVTLQTYNITTGRWSPSVPVNLKYPPQVAAATSRSNGELLIWLQQNFSASAVQSVALNTGKVGAVKSTSDLFPTQAPTDAATVASTGQSLVPVCPPGGTVGTVTLSLYDVNALSVAYVWNVTSNKWPWFDLACKFVWSPAGCV